LEYRQTYSSRSDLFWRLFGAIFLFLFGLFILAGHGDFPFLVILIGLVFWTGTILIIYGILFPTLWTGVITANEIRCLDNEVIKKSFNKNDIDKIQIVKGSVRSGSSTAGIRIIMKSGDVRTPDTVYFMDINQCVRDLKECGYPVETG
jgi:hypothetical protein